MGWATLKLDMSKAYDRVEWFFLEKFMKALGFEDNFVNLIMDYVMSVTYSFRFNGDRRGNIRPSRGLPQGDPLSPYLFLICAEGLSRMLEWKEVRGDIKGSRISRWSPSITHLFFADDCFLFFKANVNEAHEIADCLRLYALLTG